MFCITDMAGSLQTVRFQVWDSCLTGRGQKLITLVKKTNHDHNAPVNSTQELNLMNPTTGSGHFGVSVLNLSRSIRDHLVSCL